jgi:hypothetical protein
MSGPLAGSKTSIVIESQCEYMQEHHMYYFGKILLCNFYLSCSRFVFRFLLNDAKTTVVSASIEKVGGQIRMERSRRSSCRKVKSHW